MPTAELSLEQIRAHWENWATTYGMDLRATTKGTTAKQIEIATLLRTVDHLKSTWSPKAKVLEVGCGNGYNLIALCKAYPQYHYEGIDLVDGMIASADLLRINNEISKDSLNFAVGDILDMKNITDKYDLIFTDRCVINLNNDDLQLKAISNMSQRIRTGGYLLMLENSETSYNKQNNLRHAIGLEKRTPAEFNHFMRDAVIEQATSFRLKKITVENFISLHDLVLYILVPMINGGVVDYSHPIVEAATKLTIAIGDNYPEPFGDYGQNRLHLFQKI